MMADQPEKTASEKLVNNVILTLVARGAIVLATGLVLPLALMMGQRAVNNIDEIAKKLDAMRDQAFEASAAIQMQKTLSTQQGQILSDHEARVRMLEASTRRAEPISRP
jgi:hypothetical protein